MNKTSTPRILFLLIVISSITVLRTDRTLIEVAGAGLFQAGQCAAVPESLASIYKGEGNANDLAGGKNGTLIGDVGYVAGRVGQAFSFPGGEASIQVPSQNLGSNFSVEFWMNPSRLVLGNGYQHLIGNDWRTRNFGALYQFDNKVSYWVDSTLIFDSSTIQLNSWTHVALTYDGDVARLYINGVLDRTSGSFSLTFNNPVKLGDGVFRDSSFTYQGLLDEVSFYNSALNAPVIQSVFNAGATGKCSNLNAPLITLTASAGPYLKGQPVTLTADLAAGGAGQPLPTGSVTFRDGNTAIGTSNLSNAGKATLTTTALPAGARQISAVYSGDSFYRGRSSSILNIVVANTLVNASAADYRGDFLAPEQIVAAFGINLATTSQAASTQPLPTTLAGTTVRVIDSTGTERLAPLFYISPAQVNYQLPPGTAIGAATITVTSGDGSLSIQLAQIAAVAPGLFTADQSGEGLAAADILRVKPGGALVYEKVARYDEALKKYVAVPIDLSSTTDQIFLVLYGTGIRFRTALSNVTATVGGTVASVEFAGPQGMLLGLDQVNIRLSGSLAGRGDVNVVLTVDNKPAKTVLVNIK
ncbi:MAG: Ig-like domain repeat protein [Acidobacteria bacterium]|nr:Ig-like domain repeat protein [Acidobacteriota bacterium]